MRVLVAYATKNGSTEGIADAIGTELRDAGLEADVKRVGEVFDLRPYGAVVLGSAVYMGRWRPEARRFAKRNASSLRGRPVWLFGSGPIGPPAEAEKTPPSRDLAEIKAMVEARGAATFGGRLTKDTKGYIARSIVKAGKGGDFRNFEQIRAWARGVSEEVMVARPTHSRAM